MTDITKCANATCPLRHTCWRFLAPVSNTGCQSWAVYEPKIVRPVAGDDDFVICNAYWAQLQPKETNDGK